MAGCSDWRERQRATPTQMIVLQVGRGGQVQVFGGGGASAPTLIIMHRVDFHALDLLQVAPRQVGESLGKLREASVEDPAPLTRRGDP